MSIEVVPVGSSYHSKTGIKRITTAEKFGGRTAMELGLRSEERVLISLKGCNRLVLREWKTTNWRNWGQLFMPE